MTADVHIHRHAAVGHLSLARPRALHALNQAMCEAMGEALLAWHDDEGVAAVILDHADDFKNIQKTHKFYYKKY